MTNGGIIQQSTDGMQEGYVRLTAIPLEGYTFKHFIVDGQPVTDNPLITNKEWDAVFYVTMRSFLKNSVPIDVKDQALIPISVVRNFSLDADASLINRRDRDLAMADLFVFVASSPSSFTGEQDSDFYWSHKGSSYSLSNADKKNLMKQACDIYTKYGEPKRGLSIKLINI